MKGVADAQPVDREVAVLFERKVSELGVFEVAEFNEKAVLECFASELLEKGGE